jgi:hypothetical protein
VCADLSLWRDRSHVFGDDLGERALATRVQQLESRDDEIVVPDQIDSRAPFVPAARSLAAIEGRPHEADDNELDLTSIKDY